MAHAGGLPLLLPTIPEEMAVDDVIAAVDGLLFSGGGDIDPVHWHEAPHPALGTVDAGRDAFELSLFRAALARDLPVLGICRGVQVMAVATGGDLWQDIPSQCPGSLAHRQDTPRQEASHTVIVSPDSLLARICRLDDQAHETIAVNSLHHQAPR